eukprot:8099239-Pyramimonas_sp.AAC.4
MQYAIGDAREHLIEPGGSNYDVAVITSNFTAAGAAFFPMTPQEIQDRLGNAFANYDTPESTYRPGAYLLRIPSSGGHWISVLNGSFVPANLQPESTALLCDSLYTTPHVISSTQVEDLLTTCAFEHSTRSSAQDFCPWHCFLVAHRMDQ